MYGKKGGEKKSRARGWGRTIKRGRPPDRRETTRGALRGRERNETSSWDVNSYAFAAGAVPSTLYPGASIFEYLAHTCISGVEEEKEEGRNSVHSEAFGREVCSACTLHSRAVHNLYCPSTHDVAPSSSLDRWISSIVGASPYVPPFEPGAERTSTRCTQIMHMPTCVCGERPWSPHTITNYQKAL